MSEKQIIKKKNDFTLKKPNDILPIECKIILRKEVNKLTRILNKLDKELDRRKKNEK